MLVSHCAWYLSFLLSLSAFYFLVALPHLRRAQKALLPQPLEQPGLQLSLKM